MRDRQERIAQAMFQIEGALAELEELGAPQVALGALTVGNAVIQFGRAEIPPFTTEDRPLSFSTYREIMAGDEENARHAHNFWLRLLRTAGVEYDSQGVVVRAAAWRPGDRTHYPPSPHVRFRALGPDLHSPDKELSLKGVGEGFMTGDLLVLPGFGEKYLELLGHILHHGAPDIAAEVLEPVSTMHAALKAHVRGAIKGLQGL